MTADSARGASLYAPTPRSGAIALAAGLLVWLAVLVPTLGQSLWLDETAVSWLTGGGGAQLLERWQRWPYQSLFHAALALPVAALAGGSEIALRLSSVVATLAGLVVFARLARRLLTPQGATFGLLALLGSAGFLRAASFYRPYAFGLLALLVSWLCLLRWSERGRALDAFGWAVASAATLYFHLTLATALLAELPFLLRAFAAWPPARRLRQLPWLLLPAALALPLVEVVRATWTLGPTLNWTLPPTFGRLAAFLVPALPFGLVPLALLLGRLRSGRFEWDSSGSSRELWWIAVPMWSVPVIVPFLLSALTPVDVFAQQYVAGSVPGLALFAGALLARAVPKELTTAAAATLVAVIPFTAPGPYWPQPSTDPWREALAAIRAPDVDESDVVLIATDYPEARFARFDAELEPGGMLLSPLAAYPIAARTFGVATLLTPASEERLARLYEREHLGARTRFFLLQRERDEARLWFGREHPELRPHLLGLWGSLELVRFEPREGAAVSAARLGVRAPAAAHFERDQ